MSLDELIGRFATLPIRRFGPPGAFLGVGEEDVLLLGPEIPEDAEEGQELEVFLYLDSEGRPLATTRLPKLALFEVAFLKVTQLTQFGAFVDWGLPKELLVPFAEQTADMHVGSRYAIGLYRDDSGRLAGTMRVSEMLDTEETDWKKGEWVDGEAWREDDRLGLFVIVERAWVGLLPKEEPHALTRGEAARFRIANVLPDGKIELSLRRLAHEERTDDAARILAALSGPTPPKISDRSSPEEIRDTFGLSKKAFKRAVGHLLQTRAASYDAAGFLKKAR